ncbi:hypothetical protein XA1314C_39040 [Xanthomonas arboricola]|uniref:Uncharacterized protein n=1 Tax=Xanthomonas arboricola TaxID=56448 RepID=A0AAU9I7A3_9XANT|nr:hypothetical protein XA1314C_39040 [Xanthomonas arboricola]CAE6844035.1 hypothetical protein XA1314C_39040 [Xanthomonas arboricola]
MGLSWFNTQHLSHHAWFKLITFEVKSNFYRIFIFDHILTTLQVTDNLTLGIHYIAGVGIYPIIV